MSEKGISVRRKGRAKLPPPTETPSSYKAENELINSWWAA